MLKQFAPIAVIPPSPKRIAWIISATVMAIMAAHGPSRMAASAPPTACPVEPPGIGTLNIITTKLKAAPILVRKGQRAVRSGTRIQTGGR
jgi:hypothetical protein